MDRFEISKQTSLVWHARSSFWLVSPSCECCQTLCSSPPATRALRLASALLSCWVPATKTLNWESIFLARFETQCYLVHSSFGLGVQMPRCNENWLRYGKKLVRPILAISSFKTEKFLNDLNLRENFVISLSKCLTQKMANLSTYFIFGKQSKKVQWQNWLNVLVELSFIVELEKSFVPEFCWWLTGARWSASQASFQPSCSRRRLPRWSGLPPDQSSRWRCSPPSHIWSDLADCLKPENTKSCSRHKRLWEKYLSKSKSIL